MPTTTHRRVDTLANDQVSLHCGLLNIGLATRRRARKLNECERMRLTVQVRSLEKCARTAQNRQNRVIERLSKSLKELSAYHEVLNDSFRVDQFESLRFGYRVRDAKKDPSRLQRFACETKIYHSGFSIQNLRRQVRAKLVELDPEYQKAKAKKNKLERLKTQNRAVIVDRMEELSALVTRLQLQEVDDGRREGYADGTTDRQRKESGVSQNSEDVSGRGEQGTEYGGKGAEFGETNGHTDDSGQVGKVRQGCTDQQSTSVEGAARQVKQEAMSENSKRLHGPVDTSTSGQDVVGEDDKEVQQHRGHRDSRTAAHRTTLANGAHLTK